MPTLRLELSIGLGDPKAAGSLLAALEPDNVDVPDCMSIDMSADDDLRVVLSFDVACADKAASTVDEVLTHVRLAIESLGVGGRAIGRQ